MKRYIERQRDRVLRCGESRQTEKKNSIFIIRQGDKEKVRKRNEVREREKNR